MSRTSNVISLFLVPLGMVAACSTPNETTTTKGQLITCQTDPGTGVILSCDPGGGGGPNTCIDVDEDGDGDCADHTSTRGAAMDGDADGDGVPDDEDCDEHPGEDGGDHASGFDLPYDLKMSFGQPYTPIADAFAEEGGQPPVIVSVSSSGAPWRLAELQAGTSFVIDANDCSHVGNRGPGRDRVIVMWLGADGSTDADHLDLRYCE